MTVRKLESGRWFCECYLGRPDGRRLRKQFATKGEALTYERHVMDEIASKPWLA